MSNAILFSVLSLAGDKAAAIEAVRADIHTATVRTVLHGDAALFNATLKALSDKGAITKAGEVSRNTFGLVFSRLKAAEASAREARATAYPEGRKGTATAEDKSTAEGYAGTIAAAFVEAVQADKAARAEAAKATREANKAAKAAEEAAKGETAPEEAAPEESGEVVEIPAFVGISGEGLTLDGYALTWDNLRALFAEKAAIEAMQGETRKAA